MSPRRLRSSFRIAVPCALVVSLARPTAAQLRPDSTRLPAVVVTADRIERTTTTTTSTVTVLDGAALRAAGVTHLLDALRAVPGVSVARAGSYGSQTSLFLRGGESDYVRVLVDGVPMNEPGGAVDLTALTIDNVERIEVVRGPASVLYGSDAVTGVVQIFTGRATQPVAARLSVRGGTYGTNVVDGGIGIRRGGSGVTAGVARHASDGTLAFNSAYRNSVASLRAETTLPSAIQASLALRSTDDVHHYPTDGAGGVVDRNAQHTDRRFGANAEVSRAVGRNARVVVSYAALELRGRTSDPSDGPGDTLGFFAYRSVGWTRRRVADARVNLSPRRGPTFTLGVERSSEAQRSADSSNYDVSLNRFSATRLTTAAYAQLVGDRGRLSYTLGGRYDDNDTYGVFRTGRAGLAWRLWKGARVRGAVGGAFKAPTFLETFSTAFSVGNAALRPERSRSWEAGVEQRFVGGRVDLGATWFDQRFRDLIQYTFTSPVAPNYFNVASASSRGLELQARASVATGVSLWANATALRTRVDDAGFDTGPGATFVGGARLLRRPPLTVSLGTTLSRFRRLQLDVSAVRVAERDDRDFATFPAVAVELDPYTRLDAGAEYRLTTASSPWGPVTATIRVENATGARYSEIQGFPAPGRAVLAGLRVGGMR